MNRPLTHPKISCIQWRMEEMPDLDSFLKKIERHVIEQVGYGSDLVIFPEFFSLCLLDKTLPHHQNLQQLSHHSVTILQHCAKLAVRHHINILAGSLPHYQNDHLKNVATFFHRDGRTENTQHKLHPTPYEKQTWQIEGGHYLQAFDTDIGRCGILICYDVEFPELGRLLNSQGIDILLVPFWTDSLNAYHRVRYCAQARAIENECYVALAGSMGVVAGNDVIDYQHAQSAIFSPSDLLFPEHAALTEAAANEETFVMAELDLQQLERLRRKGSVQIGRDRRRDLYDIRWYGEPFIHFHALHGKDIVPHLQNIAELRIQVFREFPYLYDGTLDYELNYLQAYTNSPRSLIFLIKDGNRTIGATTALPLVDADSEFHEPFIKHGIKLEDVYYFGESVLLKPYRGQNYGNRFFDEREHFARQLGFNITTFCAVVRDTQHPLRPKDYVPHDAFWKRRGYALAEGFTCNYHWKDINQPASTNKQMQFWIKRTNSPNQIEP